MEPISTVLLAGLAGGAGGEAGQRAWTALARLVRREFRRSGTSGEAALSALERSPADPHRARSLTQVLEARAHMDAEFAAELDTWARGTRGDQDLAAAVSAWAARQHGAEGGPTAAATGSGA
ncbi:MAG: hypothetical protein HOU01_07495 [Streptomycetaceae bacterium]|nr:hypothetical protein [Streptomycetaceae bacterium]